MAPSALTYTYCSTDDLSDYLSAEGVDGRVDDDATGVVSATESAFLTKAVSWATDRINFYVEGRYSRHDLADSWVVNQWAVILACHWLSTRRGNPAPGSLADLYKETLEDLKAVHNGEHQIPGAGLRTAAFPTWSNVRVSLLEDLRRIRVQVPISEATPLPGRRNRDIASDYFIEPG